MQLKIWHNSNFGEKSFEKEVPDIDTAILLLDTLAEYDLYQGDRVTSSAQGLLVFDEPTGEWEEYYDEEGRDIREIQEVRNQG